MKVISVFAGSYPSGGAMSNRLHLYCKGLVEQGVDVRIIIPYASERFGSTANPHPNGTFDGVPYSYLSGRTTRSRHFLKRRLDDFTGYLRLFGFLLRRENRADILLVVDVRSLLRWLIFLASALTGSKTVFEINEHPLVLARKFQYWVDRRLIYPFFDGYIVISKPLFELVNRLKRRKAGIISVPIIADRKNPTFTGVPKIDIREPYILHSGGLVDRKDGILATIDAYGIVSREWELPVRYYFTGQLNGSPAHAQIREAIRTNGLDDKVRFLGYLPHEELAWYQQHSALFIINKPDTLQNNYCFPTKLGEYLSTGKPVILSDIGEANRFLADRVSAYVVEAGNSRQIAEKIRDIVTSPETSAVIGRNGQETALTAFDYRQNAGKLIRFFESLIQR